MRVVAPYIHPSKIRERDLDLLVLEEFYSCRDFQKFFLSQLREAIPVGSIFVGGSHAVSDSTGESDLEIEFRRPNGKKWRILIENKVDASFQPRQATRYRERCQGYVRRGECDGCLTVLVGTERYLSSASSRFDFGVSYESLYKWFDSAGLPGSRRQFKVALLRAALDKGMKIRSKNPQVSSFWFEYWRLTLEIAPELQMPEPSPKSGSFIYFWPPPLPNGITFIHKVSYGNMDLQFSQMGKHLGEMEDMFQGRLLPSMQIRKAGQSAVIRTRVPRLSMKDNLSTQSEEAKQCILAAKAIADWLAKHRDVLRKRRTPRS